MDVERISLSGRLNDAEIYVFFQKQNKQKKSTRTCTQVLRRPPRRRTQQYRNAYMRCMHVKRHVIFIRTGTEERRNDRFWQFDVRTPDIMLIQILYIRKKKKKRKQMGRTHINYTGLDVIARRY